MLKQTIDRMNGPYNNPQATRLALRCVFGLLSATALLYTGCSMCCGPFDYHYPVFGGTVQRSDPVHGRVGSVYSDPGPFGGPPADSNLNRGDTDSKTNDLESLDDDDSELEIPEELMDGELDDTDVLPPPDLRRPGPDDDVNSVRRLRTQSWQRGYRQQWR